MIKFTEIRKQKRVQLEAIDMQSEDVCAKIDNNSCWFTEIFTMCFLLPPEMDRCQKHACEQNFDNYLDSLTCIGFFAKRLCSFIGFFSKPPQRLGSVNILSSIVLCSRSLSRNPLDPISPHQILTHFSLPGKKRNMELAVSLTGRLIGTDKVVWRIIIGTGRLLAELHVHTNTGIHTYNMYSTYKYTYI